MSGRSRLEPKGTTVTRIAIADRDLFAHRDPANGPKHKLDVRFVGDDFGVRIVVVVAHRPETERERSAGSPAEAVITHDSRLDRAKVPLWNDQRWTANDLVT